MIAFSLFSLLAGAIAAPTSNPPVTTSPSVSTAHGTFIGRSFAGVESFLGIPFAQPPVGNLRFAPPVPLRNNVNLGVVNATVSHGCFNRIGSLLILNRLTPVFFSIFLLSVDDAISNPASLVLRWLETR